MGKSTGIITTNDKQIPVTYPQLSAGPFIARLYPL
jgi:hypothetical protein